MNKSTSINSKQFKKELSKKNQSDDIYLFTGEEEGEKEKVISALIEKIIPDDADRSYSVGRFHIENGEFMEAAKFVLSQSMFASRMICICKNIDSLQVSKESKDLLQEVIENRPDSTIIIFTSSGNFAPKSIPTSLRKDMKVVQFWRYFENELHPYIQNRARELQLMLDGTATTRLIQLLGRDIQKIDNALEKLRNLAPGSSVTADMVTQVITDERDISVFDFIDALFLRKKSTFTLLKKLIEGGTFELVILSMIMRQAEIIEQYHSLISRGYSEGESLSSLKINPKKRTQFAQFVKNNPPEILRNIFPLIFRADLNSKTGGRTNSMLSNPIFDLTIQYLCG